MVVTHENIFITLLKANNTDVKHVHIFMKSNSISLILFISLIENLNVDWINKTKTIYVRQINAILPIIAN